LKQAGKIASRTLQLGTVDETNDIGNDYGRDDDSRVWLGYWPNGLIRFFICSGYLSGNNKRRRLLAE
jgi:hypothetical protein